MRTFLDTNLDYKTELLWSKWRKTPIKRFNNNLLKKDFGSFIGLAPGLVFKVKGRMAWGKRAKSCELFYNFFSSPNVICFKNGLMSKFYCCCCCCCFYCCFWCWCCTAVVTESIWAKMEKSMNVIHVIFLSKIKYKMLIK